MDLKDIIFLNACRDNHEWTIRRFLSKISSLIIIKSIIVACENSHIEIIKLIASSKEGNIAISVNFLYELQEQFPSCSELLNDILIQFQQKEIGDERWSQHLSERLLYMNYRKVPVDPLLFDDRTSWDI